MVLVQIGKVLVIPSAFWHIGIRQRVFLFSLIFPFSPDLLRIFYVLNANFDPTHMVVLPLLEFSPASRQFGLGLLRQHHGKHLRTLLDLFLLGTELLHQLG